MSQGERGVACAGGLGALMGQFSSIFGEDGEMAAERVGLEH